MTRLLPAALLLLIATTTVTAQQASAPQEPSPPATTPPAATVPAVPPAQQPLTVREPGTLRARTELLVGTGRFEFTTEGNPSRSGKADGGYLRVGFELIGENDVGGGIRLEAVRTDDDLFRDSGGIRSHATDSELFLHGTGLFGIDDVALPLRFGLFARNLGYDDKTNSTSIEWQTIGVRVEAEPEFTLATTGDLRWSLNGRFGFGFGLTTVSTEPSTEDVDSKMTGLDVGLGTRLQIAPVELGIGWVFRHVTLAESDPVNGVPFAAVDGEFSGWFVTFVARF